MSEKNQRPAPDYETAIKELEAIIQQMESSTMPLDLALQIYKRGTELLNICQQALVNAEQQVRILSEAHQLQPFNIE